MAKKEKKKLLTFGPFEQVLLALLVMVFGLFSWSLCAVSVTANMH